MARDRPIHVLAVATDDLPELVRRLSRSDRIEVSTARSIETALEVISEGGVECVVCDHDPPALDGAALLEAIRTRAPDLPVVVFAAGEAARRATAAGATDTLAEPVDTRGQRLPELVQEAVAYYRVRGERLAREARAAMYLDAARDAIAVVQDGQYVFANDRLLDLFRVERREHLVATPFPGHVTIEGVALDEARIAAVANGQQTFEATVGTLERSAGPLPVEVSAQPGVWAGRPATVVVLRDVSEVRRVEERLRNYEQAVESSTDLLAALDRDRRFLFANDVYCEYHGVDPSTIAGRSLADVLSPTALADVAGSVEQVLEGESVQYETVREHPDLGNRLLDVRYYPLWAENGRVRGYGSTIRDVTERTERISQLGKIDRILRHNARNSLNVITGHAEMIESEGDVGVRAHASKILETSEALLDIFENERRIARLLADAPSRERVDVTTVVRSAVESVAERYAEASYSLSAPQTAVVRASPHLSEAVMELLENAVVHADEPTPAVQVEVRAEGDSVAVEVIDTGPRIPETEVAVTTEDGSIDPLNHGRGLGLWFVSLVVKRSGGRLVFDANEPRGNVVRILLSE